MSSHERAPAHAAKPDLQHRAAAGDKDDDPSVEWDDLVASIDEQLVEVSDEATDKALSPHMQDDFTDAAVPRPTDDASGAQAQSRARRATVVSPIPAMLAQSMGRVPEPSGPAGAPRATVSAHTEITRPIVETAAPATPARTNGSSGYDIEVVEVLETPLTPARKRALELIERARACHAKGDLPGAVLAADEVLAGSESRTSPMADLIESARPLFDRIFASYVGLLGEVPVMARSDQEIASLALDDKTRALLSRVDGKLTLEKLLAVSKIPPVEAMRIAASLMSAGIIRVA
jgi:hypothetical protein